MSETPKAPTTPKIEETTENVVSEQVKTKPVYVSSTTHDCPCMSHLQKPTIAKLYH